MDILRVKVNLKKGLIRNGKFNFFTCSYLWSQNKTLHIDYLFLFMNWIGPKTAFSFLS